MLDRMAGVGYYIGRIGPLGGKELLMGNARKALFLLVFVLLYAAHVEALEVVVNAGCEPSRYEEQGLWYRSVSKSILTNCGTGSRVSEEPGAYAKFKPSIPATGIYDVFSSWGDWTDGPYGLGANAVNVTFNVHGMTDASVAIDQKTSRCEIKNSDSWIYLGRMEFQQGNSSYVKIVNTSTDRCYRRCRLGKCPSQFIVADAVKLVYVGPVPVNSPNWGMVKALYK